MKANIIRRRPTSVKRHGEPNVMRLDPFIVLIILSSVFLAMRLPYVAPPVLSDSGARKELFEKRCTGCHTLDHEKSGPRLRGIFGRAAASVSSFPYSKSLRKSGVVWNTGSLDKWLTDPDGFIPDNNMAFRVGSKTERAAIIEYLKEVSLQR